ncbi:MAG: MnhB domain-containing protein [Lautropia sp.]
MKSPILEVGTRLILPLCLLLSLVLLWRGHNAPGGGFVGGLVAAAGVMCHAIAHGEAAMRRVLLQVSPEAIAGLGLAFAAASGMAALAGGDPYLTHRWLTTDGGFAVGTALLFDLGVYLAVLGGVCTLLVRYLELP